MMASVDLGAVAGLQDTMRKAIVTESEKEAAAATRIQATFRGRASRKRIVESAARLSMANVELGVLNVLRKNVAGRGEEDATHYWVTRIQAAFRGRMARKNQTSEQEARAAELRMKAKALRMAAILRIQCNFRGRMQRKKLERERKKQKQR